MGAKRQAAGTVIEGAGGNRGRGRLCALRVVGELVRGQGRGAGRGRQASVQYIAENALKRICENPLTSPLFSPRSQCRMELRTSGLCGPRWMERLCGMRRGGSHPWQWWSSDSGVLMARIAYRNSARLHSSHHRLHNAPHPPLLPPSRRLG
ncbi:hypothetical protein M427DRAFT_476681 [Gonapodya prolifera JEL478]|uniref:Uncharacterized protein n=1 Tax=Gonapodya prolifera (strain JEL478) TaxID=1344416 RepID=A0A139A267_GONPJ|nr:hypothetical protein M427DRAFT_476681 [Gonapodya prolifera JEL478]|eukprot:KXS10453.1 hypothetical protein M427DRAFT_476681 [Gonapodya prolifera JEL478]